MIKNLCLFHSFADRVAGVPSMCIRKDMYGKPCNGVFNDNDAPPPCYLSIEESVKCYGVFNER